MKKGMIILAALLVSANVFSQGIKDPSVKMDSLNKILIKPIQLSVLDTTKAVSMKIVSVLDDLGTSAQFYISLYDVRNKKIFDQNMTITGTEYSNWDRKVGYIARLYCTKYGLSLL
ncbi:MAG: hypothetical protein V4557_09645 [Bacteroidota bacterium]